MNKTNKKASKRTLLIVFIVLIIALVSWNVMVLAAEITCPADVDLGNLNISVTGWGAAHNTGYAEIKINYPRINLITDLVLSYCGYPQLFMSARMRGRGDSVDSVKSHIGSLARKFSCNAIDRTVYKELMLSEGPIRVDGTTEIKENRLFYEGEIRYTVEDYCGASGKKKCKIRKKELVSCQKEITKNSARSITRGADNYIRMLNKSFLARINNLGKNEVDAYFEEVLMDTYAECCDNGTVTTTCNDDSECGDITYSGSSFCQGRNIAQNTSTPTCMSGGTISSSCSEIDSSEIVEYCVPDQACQAAVCTSPASCSGDDDGGMDYLTQGTVVTDIYNFTDDCENSQYLIEYGCQASALAYERVDCTATPGKMCWEGVCGDILPGSIGISDVLAYIDNPTNTEPEIIEAFEQRDAIIVDYE